MKSETMTVNRFICLTPANRRILLVLLLAAILCVLASKIIGQSPVSPTSDRDRREVKTVPLWSFDTSYFNFGNNNEGDQLDGLVQSQAVGAGSRCGHPALSPIGVRKEFLEKLPLVLPDDYSKPMEVILEEDWVCDLQEFLSKVDPEKRLVNMIAANSNFTDPILNWLISSRLRLEEPMIDVIVISLDSPLHELLISRGIPSLLITPSSVMFTEDFPEVYHKHNGFYQARMMVMRLISHWGYNTANYDTDAIVMKNPQLIYDADEYADFDIIAGFAISFPPALHKIWGATLCNGAWMVRSNHRTELFWEHVALTPNAGCERGMDQCKVNYALHRMKLNWTTTAHSVKEFDLDSEWAAFGDVNILILPLRVICRQRFCEEEHLSDYYIWHKGSCDKTAEAKRESVLEGGLWWLRDDWKDISAVRPDVVGDKWLSAIANYSTMFDT